LSTINIYLYFLLTQLSYIKYYYIYNEEHINRQLFKNVKKNWENNMENTYPKGVVINTKTSHKMEHSKSSGYTPFQD